MRKNKYSWFDHWWQITDSWSVGRVILLPFVTPILFTKLAIYLLLFALVVYEAMAFFSAMKIVVRVFQEAEAHGQTDQSSNQAKGGERQGNTKGFLIRPGGSLNSDDLRRRLYELRASDKDEESRRAPKIGGQ